MYLLLQHLESLQLSMMTLSMGTGLMLGAFVGMLAPVYDPDTSRWLG